MSYKNEHLLKISYSIYVITNKVNGKKYVGQTMNLERRFVEHWNYETNEHLYNSMTKYGIENFSFEVLQVGLTKEEADREETRLIEEWDTMNFSKGYNRNAGGSNGSLSEETRRKISEAQKGVKPPQEIVEKRRNALLKHYENHDYPLKGVPFTEERKANMRKAIKKGEENHNWNKGKPVEQIDVVTGDVIATYPCVMAASRTTGVHFSGITDICTGCNPNRKTAGGYKWKFITD